MALLSSEMASATHSPPAIPLHQPRMLHCCSAPPTRCVRTVHRLCTRERCPRPPSAILDVRAARWTRRGRWRAVGFRSESLRASVLKSLFPIRAPSRSLSTFSTNMTDDNKQWFSETEALWPGQKFSLQMEEVLFQGKSDFQDVLVFKSSTYGNVLVLDGVIQCTERDEFSYQEMITHLPMYAHAAPKTVLIVGGGDFGVLREVAKHDTVEKIIMCEIDPMVCDVAKKFFTNSLAKNFNDPRLTLLHADAAAYLRDNTTEEFDVIIVDSSDPVGPAEVLFRAEFYENMKKSLAPNGIVCTQGECLWLHLDLIAEVLTRCHAFFPTVQYAYTTIPSYPSGQIGFVMCSLDDSQTALTTPKRTPSAEVAETLRYYSTALHPTAFVLPTFAERKIAPVRKTGTN